MSLTLILLFIIVEGLFILPPYINRKKKNIRKDQTIYIDPGATKDSLLNILSPNHKDEKSFIKVFNKEASNKELRPSMYKIKADATNNYIVRAFVNGWQSPMNLTLSGNIRGLERLSAQLGARLLQDSLAFITYFNNTYTSSTFGTASANLQSIFLPITSPVCWY